MGYYIIIFIYIYILYIIIRYCIAYLLINSSFRNLGRAENNYIIIYNIRAAIFSQICIIKARPSRSFYPA
nr:MAG TPA: hypothetical protein [Caudoviricetes sp.]